MNCLYLILSYQEVLKRGNVNIPNYAIATSNKTKANKNRTRNKKQTTKDMQSKPVNYLIHYIYIKEHIQNMNAIQIDINILFSLSSFVLSMIWLFKCIEKRKDDNNNNNKDFDNSNDISILEEYDQRSNDSDPHPHEITPYIYLGNVDHSQDKGTNISLLFIYLL